MRHAVDDTLAAFAAEIGTDGPVAVEGGRTRWGLGRTGVGDASAGDASVDDETRLVRAPSGIVEHLPEEMTVRVRAGTAVAELADALAEVGQRCALPDRGLGPAGPATVGGAIAIGENHPEMLGRGRLRDSVLEVRYVSAEGLVIVGGGPTVKNVTGFDLPRLLTGSRGRLGLIGEVVLRTNPIPPVSRWVSATGADPRQVRRAVLRPGAIAWDGETVWVGLEGHGADVDTELSRLRTVGDFAETDTAPTLGEHRWSVTPAEQYDTVAGSGVVALIGTGLSFGPEPQPPRSPDPGSLAVTARLLDGFDPTRRLNPAVAAPGTEGSA